MSNYTPPAGIAIAPPEQSRITPEEEIGVLIPQHPRHLDVQTLIPALDGACVLPCGVHRTKTPWDDVTFGKVFGGYIAPELKRRQKQGENPNCFLPISEALIVLPPAEDPDRFNVFLNDEVEVQGKVDLKYAGEIAKGDALPADKIHHIESLTLRQVRTDTDGFIWLRHEPRGYALYFNFVPCNPDISLGEEMEDQLAQALREGMASQVLRGFYEEILDEDPTVRQRMTSDGWFPAPVLIPKPWDEMCEAYRNGQPADAAKLAMGAVDDSTLDAMLNNWSQSEPFASDFPFLSQAVDHYKSGNYISAVSVLLPRIEGLSTRALGKAEKWPQYSDLVKGVEQVSSAATGPSSGRWINDTLHSRLREVTEEFFDYGFDPDESDALGRNAHTHGVTSAEHYDQAYALKVILAVDGLYFILNR